MKKILCIYNTVAVVHMWLANTGTLANTKEEVNFNFALVFEHMINEYIFRQCSIGAQKTCWEKVNSNANGFLFS